MAKRTPGAPTALNLSVLRQVANGRTEFPNRIEATAAPHMMRCLRAGLVRVSGADVSVLVLTPSGIAAIGGLS